MERIKQEAAQIQNSRGGREALPTRRGKWEVGARRHTQCPYWLEHLARDFQLASAGREGGRSRLKLREERCVVIQRGGRGPEVAEKAGGGVGGREDLKSGSRAEGPPRLLHIHRECVIGEEEGEGADSHSPREACLYQQHMPYAGNEGPASRQAGKQASRQAGKQASRQAGKQASRQAGKQASRQAGRNVVQSTLSTRARGAWGGTHSGLHRRCAL